MPSLTVPSPGDWVERLMPLALASLLARQVHFAESVDEKVETLAEMAREALALRGSARQGATP